MTITLTQAQLNIINTDYINKVPGKPDYAGMYQYIFKEVGSQMPTDQRYWFQQAAEINKYLNNPTVVPATPSAYFIQQINIELA